MADVGGHWVHLRIQLLLREDEGRYVVPVEAAELLSVHGGFFVVRLIDDPNLHRSSDEEGFAFLLLNTLHNETPENFACLCDVIDFVRAESELVNYAGFPPHSHLSRSHWVQSAKIKCPRQR